MTDDELRTLVRETLTRVLGHPHASGAPAPPPAMLSLHASHGRFVLPRGSDTDGSCLIEPSVRCNHCGYCQSYGH
jgi:hypothetical protein